MNIFYKIDANGFYLYPVIVDDLPKDCVSIRPPHGLFKGKFVNGSWLEGATQEEISAIKNAPRPLSELELLKKQQELMQKALDDIIFSYGGGF